MSKYDRLKRENKANREKVMSQYNGVKSNVDEISKDVEHTAIILSNPDPYLAEIDEKFERITKLKSVDWAFLFFAVALQCVRQYFITNFKVRLTDQEAANKTRGHNEEHSARRDGEWFLPTCEEIVINPVPYDANRQIEGIKGALEGAGALGHRLVLGHDPILGWVFGTSNIATSTLTTWKFETYHIRTRIGNTGRGTACFDHLTHFAETPEMLDIAFERFFQTGKEGVAVLATSLIKEWVHLKSDVNTKNSLPFPLISTVSPDLANTFADYGIDMGNILTVSKQFLYAEGINIIIEILHGLYCIYSESSNPENELLTEEIKMHLDLLKVRTKKIIMWSNVIASTSNLLAVSGIEIAALATDNPLLATKGKQYLDIGGYIATLHRLIYDQKFINQVKAEFVMNEWEKLVIGDDYSFVEGRRDE